METLETRLKKVARIAVRLEEETGCPNLQIAHWTNESNWGEKSAGRANYFGIKKADRTPSSARSPQDPGYACLVATITDQANASQAIAHARIRPLRTQ